MTTPDPSQNGHAPQQEQPAPAPGAAIEALKSRINILRAQKAEMEDTVDYANSMYMTATNQVGQLAERNSQLIGENDQLKARVAELESATNGNSDTPTEVPEDVPSS